MDPLRSFGSPLILSRALGSRALKLRIESLPSSSLRPSLPPTLLPSLPLARPPKFGDHYQPTTLRFSPSIAFCLRHTGRCGAVAVVWRGGVGWGKWWSHRAHPATQAGGGEDFPPSYVPLLASTRGGYRRPCTSTVNTMRCQPPSSGPRSSQHTLHARQYEPQLEADARARSTMTTSERFRIE